MKWRNQKCVIKMFLEKFPPNSKKSPIEIASAHIYIPTNNAAKFHNGPIDSLRGVADKGPLYLCICKKWF